MRERGPIPSKKVDERRDPVDGGLAASPRCDRRRFVALPLAWCATSTGGVASATAGARGGGWRRRAALPLAKDDFGTAVVDGRIYTFGGMTGARGTVLDEVTVYDPATDTWRSLPPLPTPRRSVRAAAIGSAIYVVGGVAESGAVDAVDVFDAEAETWSSFPPMTTARYGVGLAVIDDSLVVAGGFADGQAQAMVEGCDPSDGGWRTLASMPTARTHLVLLAVGDRLLACGGEADRGALAKVETYDPLADRWAAGADLPVPLSNFGGAVLDGRIHLLHHHEHRVFDPATSMWSTEVPMPTSRHGQGVAVVDGLLYAVGGCHQQLFDLDVNEVFVPASVAST